MILGTFQYMAPEQIEGAEADARTDIFAFGCVLHEILTGQKAFDGKTHASLIAAILEQEPPPITALQPLAPPLVDAIVRKCLAKRADDRWQSAADLASALRWAADALVVGCGRNERSHGRAGWRDRDASSAFQLGGGRARRVCRRLVSPGATYRSQRRRPPTVRFEVVPPPDVLLSPIAGSCGRAARAFTRRAPSRVRRRPEEPRVSTLGAPAGWGAGSAAGRH